MLRDPRHQIPECDIHQSGRMTQGSVQLEGWLLCQVFIFYFAKGLAYNYANFQANMTVYISLPKFETSFKIKYQC